MLAGAGMSLADLVRLIVYTTDVDLLFQHYGVLGVTRLAIPGQMVELEGTAVA